MVSGSAASQHSSNKNQSRTSFPGQFLEDFGGTFGRGVSLEELLAGLPRSSSLFGGSPVGILPTGNAAPQQNLPYAPVTNTPQLYWQNQAKNAGAGNNYEAGRGPNGQPLPGAGQSPGFPGAQVAPGINGPGASSYQEGSFVDPNAAVGPRFQASGSSLGGFDAQGGMQRLGFGQAPEDYRGAQELNIRNAPTINAAVAQAAQAGPAAQTTAAQGQAAQAASAQAAAAQMALNGGNLNGLQNALFHAQYDPIAREMGRQGSIEDRQLQANLAGAGLASSGSGIGQIQAQGRERSQRMQDAASDAAQRAAAQRYGYEFSQEEQNAGMRQQTNLANAGAQQQANLSNAERAQQASLSNADRRQQAAMGNADRQQAAAEADASRRQQTALANAGFNQQAQIANADNILKGDVARSDSYLKTIGLNVEAASKERADFLQAMNLGEQDLARMDNFQQQTLGLLLNNWLQQMGAAGQLGRETEGSGKGASYSAQGGVQFSGPASSA